METRELTLAPTALQVVTWRTGDLCSAGEGALSVHTALMWQTFVGQTLIYVCRANKRGRWRSSHL